MATCTRLGALLVFLMFGCSLVSSAPARMLLAHGGLQSYHMGYFLVRSFNLSNQVFSPPHSEHANMNPGGITNTGVVSGYAAIQGNKSPYVSFKFNAPKSVNDFHHSWAKLNIGNKAFANGLNKAGIVVGGGSSLGFGAYYYKGGKAYKINKPVDGTVTGGIAYGINNKGDVVGRYVKGGSKLGFLWLGKNGAVNFDSKSKQLKLIKPSKTAYDVRATAINNNRIVVGYFNPSKPDELVRPGYEYTAGFTYNAATGAYRVHKDVEPHGEYPPVFTRFLGISDSLLVVGYYKDVSGAEYGFLYDARASQRKYLAVFDHPDASDLAGDGVTYTQFTGISPDSKYITGHYVNADGYQQGFVLKKPYFRTTLAD